MALFSAEKGKTVPDGKVKVRNCASANNGHFYSLIPGAVSFVLR